MASEIRVDTLKTTSGLGTVTFGNNGVVLSGIVTASSLNANNITSNNISATNTLSAPSISASSSFVGNGTIPIGGIIMWSGTIALIPSGWKLCNGTNGTPDLRSKFIVGATSDASTGVTFNATTGVESGEYAPGNSGGEVAHKLTTAEMPAHKHTTSVDGTNLFPATGATTISFGGAGSYPATIFSMNNAGSDNYHENRPPYYALAFIMRTS